MEDTRKCKVPLNRRCGKLLTLGKNKGLTCNRVKYKRNPLCKSHMDKVADNNGDISEIPKQSVQVPPDIQENSPKPDVIETPVPPVQPIIKVPPSNIPEIVVGEEIETFVVNISDDESIVAKPKVTKVVVEDAAAEDEEEDDGVGVGSFNDIDVQSEIESEAPPKRELPKDQQQIALRIMKRYRLDDTLEDRVPYSSIEDLELAEQEKLLKNDWSQNKVDLMAIQGFGASLIMIEELLGQAGINMTGLHSRLNPDYNPNLKDALQHIALDYVDLIAPYTTPQSMLAIEVIKACKEVYTRNLGHGVTEIPTPRTSLVQNQSDVSEAGDLIQSSPPPQSKTTQPVEVAPVYTRDNNESITMVDTMKGPSFNY